MQLCLRYSLSGQKLLGMSQQPSGNARSARFGVHVKLHDLFALVDTNPSTEPCTAT